MVFPSSVEQIITTTRKKRQPRVPKPIAKVVPHDELPAGVGVGGTTLDVGRLGGTTLVQEDGKWRWDWVSHRHPHLRIKVGDEGVLLFPGEKNTHPAQIDLTLDETLRSTHDFLAQRLNAEDHLGVREVVHRQIHDDAPGSSTAPFTTPTTAHDIYHGTKLVLLHHAKSKIARNMVCFPTGPLGNRLNISPFLPASNAQSGGTGVTRFVPTAQSVFDFPTSILQIASSPAISSNKVDRDAICIAVRLQSSSHLFHVVPDHAYLPPTSEPPVHLSEVGRMSLTDSYGLRHMDIALDPTSFGRALIVDEKGGVTLWTERKVERSERLVPEMISKQVRPPVTDQGDTFFRIAWGSKPDTALVMSRTEIIMLDLEGDLPPETLLTLRGAGRMFTSIDKTAAARGAEYTVVATTYEVIWLDGSVSERPVLSWNHDYGGGNVHDLEVTYLKHDDEDCILLSSQSEKDILAFRVSSHPPIRSLHPPYPLPIPARTPHLVSLGFVKLQRHSNDLESPTQLMGITPNGGIWTVPIISKRISEQSDRRRKQPLVLDVHWDAAIRNIYEGKTDDVEERSIMSDENPDRDIVTTRYREINFKWLWHLINDREQAKQGTHTLRIGDFERYLRELDAPFEHVMTAGDLARDCLHGETSELRSSLLRPVPVEANSAADLSSIDIARQLSVVSTLDEPPNLQAIFLPSKESRRIYTDARLIPDLRQLSTDLALSRMILHSDDIAHSIHKSVPDSQFTNTDTPEDLFAHAASQLSLGDKDPPPVRFSFLMPRPSSHNAVDESTRLDALQNMSARALLDEWTIGSDPREYDWKPWTGKPLQSANPSHRVIRPLPSIRSPSKLSQPRPQSQFLPVPSQPRHVPALRPAASLPSLIPLPPVVARSSPPPAPSSSQIMGNSQGDFMVAQTQVEPGRFGGRAVTGTKKKVKKRAGGF